MDLLSRGSRDLGARVEDLGHPDAGGEDHVVAVRDEEERGAQAPGVRGAELLEERGHGADLRPRPAPGLVRAQRHLHKG